jgi:hypothetical protein
MEDIFVGKLCVPGVQSDLSIRKVSEELTATSSGSHLIRLGDFDCRDEDMMEPHHPALHHECLFLSLVRKQLPSSRSRAVMHQPPSSSNSDEPSIGAQSRVPQRPILPHVCFWDLGGRGINPPRWQKEQAITLMCCHTSDSGFITLMSGCSAPRYTSTRSSWCKNACRVLS